MQKVNILLPKIQNKVTLMADIADKYFETLCHVNKNQGNSKRQVNLKKILLKQHKKRALKSSFN